MTRQEAEAFIARHPRPDAVFTLMAGLEADGILDSVATLWTSSAGETIDLLEVWRALHSDGEHPVNAVSAALDGKDKG